MQLIMYHWASIRNLLLHQHIFFITYHESHISLIMENWAFNLICSFYLKRVLCRYILIPQILLVAFRRNLLTNPTIVKSTTDSAAPRRHKAFHNLAIFFTVSLLLGIEYSMGDGYERPYGRKRRAIAFWVCVPSCFLLPTGMSDETLVGVRYRANWLCSSSAPPRWWPGMWISNLHGYWAYMKYPLAGSAPFPWS